MRTLALAAASALFLSACAVSSEDPQVVWRSGDPIELYTPIDQVIGEQADCAHCNPPAMPTALDPESVAAADPYLWLEDVNGERAMDWVREQNAASLAQLEGDPRYETFREQAYDILSATDRIAMPHMQDGMVYNFWQDDAHPKGIWRRATPESYRYGQQPTDPYRDVPEVTASTPAHDGFYSADPREPVQWETVLDLDALAAAEGRDWVWKGATCYGPDERLCLVALSDGGGDAVEVREYDTHARTFVDGGFVLPMGKHRYDWLDADTLLVAADFGEVEGRPSLTESGYPYIVRALDRGQTLAEATTVFSGQLGDGGYGVNPSVYRGPEGEVEAVIITRPLDTFRSETWALINGGPVRLNLPERVTIWGTSSALYPFPELIFSVEEPWSELPSFGEIAAGTLLHVSLDYLANNPDAILITSTGPTLFRPGPRQSLDNVAITRSGIVVSYYDNVVGGLRYLAPGLSGGRHRTWLSRDIEVPDNSSVALIDAGRSSDAIYYSVEGFLTPTTLYAADAATGESQVVAELPARFDASTLVVEQFEVTSSDGTRIPYFIVRPRDLAMDGSAPTILFGYGGFQISKPADYIPEMGALWLQNGGVFVNANIRGGGEFGPAWHQAVLRENRQLSFDDFAAVAQDLIARGITSPDHLGIYGRSNGGVLTSVSIVQHPELFDAAVIESPLVDMLRYHELPAGASWMGEYGDPRTPEDAAFIARYSAYQNVEAGRDYPQVYLTTNTHDDRVHPGHARKFAARLEAFGYDPIYFEDTAGGHSYDADPAANARRWARHYVYFSQRLMDD